MMDSLSTTRRGAVVQGFEIEELACPRDFGQH